MTTHQKIVDQFLHRSVHVFGASGAEGSAVLLWLVGHSVPHIVAHDVLPADSLMNEWHRVHEGATDAEAEEFASLLTDKSISWKLAAEYESMPGVDDIIFLPQSWFRYSRNDFLRELFLPTLVVKPEHVARIWSLTRLYFALFTGTLIAITGADGKTTTTKMIGSIMSAYAASLGVSCIESGNDRSHAQSLVAVENATAKDYLVLEVSDRQLSFGFPLAPDIAVVTNITPNKHMDDYGGFEKYVGVKSHLLQFQSAAQTAVLNADDTACREQLINVGAGKRTWTSLHTRPERGAWIDHNQLAFVSGGHTTPVLPITDLKIFGAHNISNALLAATAAQAAGVPDSMIAETLSNFQPVAHRLQPVGTWKGILFIEDSAGGNPVNIAATIRTFTDRNLVLLVGGYRPNLTAAEVADMLTALQAAHSIHTLVLFGQVRQALAVLVEEATKGTVPVVCVENLAAAFTWIHAQSGELSALPSPIVCMTPGFESFDQHKDYRARAAHYVELVNSLC